MVDKHGSWGILWCLARYFWSYYLRYRIFLTPRDRYHHYSWHLVLRLYLWLYFLNLKYFLQFALLLVRMRRSAGRCSRPLSPDMKDKLVLSPGGRWRRRASCLSLVRRRKARQGGGRWGTTSRTPQTSPPNKHAVTWPRSAADMYKLY